MQVVLSGNNQDAHSLSVDLYSDVSTHSGSAIDHIGSLSDSSIITNCNCLYDFPTAPFALSANTRYWIGLSTSNGSAENWVIEGPFLGQPNDVGVTGEFIDDTGVVSGDRGEAFEMKVTVSPTVTTGVPEPSAFLLFATALVVLMLGLRRSSASRN